LQGKKSSLPQRGGGSGPVKKRIKKKFGDGWGKMLQDIKHAEEMKRERVFQ